MINYTDEKLCQIVAASRYLGSLREEALSAMKELARRRGEGSEFDFEAAINEISKSLPDFKISMPIIFKGNL